MLNDLLVNHKISIRKFKGLGVGGSKHFMKNIPEMFVCQFICGSTTFTLVIFS